MASLVSLLDKYTQKGDIIKTVQDYDRTEAATLFRQVIANTAGSKNSIDGFNNWVEIIMPQQIIDKSFVSESGVKVTFSDVFLSNPVRVVNTKEIKLYPQFSRDHHLPYVGKLEATCTTEKENEKRTIRINFGNIPIMLGSKKCNLYGKTPEELVELGECITDPFGYFIVSSEWTLVTIDKMRHNLPLISIDKTEGKASIANQYCGNKRIQLKLSKDWNSIRLVDPNSTREESSVNTFPIFLIFKILANLEPEEVINDYIFRFIEPNLQKRMYNKLTFSIFDYTSITDPIQYVYSIRNEYTKISEDNKKKITDDISDNLEKGIFVTIDDENKKIRVEKKILVLSYMIARLLLNEKTKDNPDSWNNKRFDNAHNHMEDLFSNIIKNVFNKCKHKKGTREVNDNFINFGDYLNSKSKDEFKKTFETSFNTGTWGVKDLSFVRENIREMYRRDTPMTSWSQIVKNTNSSVDKTGNMTAPREVQPTQRNRHCIMESPDGQNIGIVRFNCLSGIFSLRRDPSTIIDFLKKYGKEYSKKVNNILILVNGKPCHKDDFVLYGDKDFKDILIDERRKGKIPLDAEICFTKELNLLEIFTDSSRALAPFLIVNQKTGKLVIEEKDAWDLDYQTLLTNGCLEYLDAREEDNEDITIAPSVEKFHKTRRDIDTATEEEVEKLKKIYNYSHCSIDPMQMFSLPTSACPLSNHQMAPRTSYQAGMTKQALGYYNINYHLRYDKQFKQLYKGERSMTETDTYFLPKMDLLPNGQITNVGFLCHADNQEDAVVVCEDYINAGNFNYVKYQVNKYEIPSATKGSSIQFKIPPLKINEDPHIYRHLEENGLPRLDSYIEPGDCILGKVKITPQGVENESEFADKDINGYIDRILITRDGDKRKPIVRIKIRSYNKYEAGDKLALRYAQKGTIGRVVKREEMPIVSSGPNKGITPDLLFNPHGFPSRQTAGLLIEGILTKASMYDGKRRDVSAFRSNAATLDEAMKTLRENGFDENGYEEMETSSGIKLKDKVCMVPLYEQVLKHQAKGKFQFRNFGNRDFRTHQPQAGRVKGGGIRVGEMEKDAFVAHGASHITLERMMKSSDEFSMVVCNNCGVIINYKFCTVCNNSDPVLVTIPFVFKSLIRLLSGTGIDIRLKTKKIKELI